MLGSKGGLVYAMSVGGVTLVILGVAVARSPGTTIALAVLGVTLMVGGWLRQRHMGPDGRRG